MTDLPFDGPEFLDGQLPLDEPAVIVTKRAAQVLAVTGQLAKAMQSSFDAMELSGKNIAILQITEDDE